MKKKDSIFLEITDIVWAQSEKGEKKLPKELDLQWNGKVWNDVQVSDWLSEYFKVKVDSLNIKELDNKAGSG